MRIRIRFGTALARLAPAPVIALELAEGATVADLYDRLATTHPELGPALRSALPLIHGTHTEPDHRLSKGEEVALLTPVAGG